MLENNPCFLKYFLNLALQICGGKETTELRLRGLIQCKQNDPIRSEKYAYSKRNGWNCSQGAKLAFIENPQTLLKTTTFLNLARVVHSLILIPNFKKKKYCLSLLANTHFLKNNN